MKNSASSKVSSRRSQVASNGPSKARFDAKTKSSDAQPLAIRLLPAIYIGLLFAAFALGVIWQRVEDLGKSQTNTQQVAVGQQQPPTPQPVSLDMVKSLFSQELIAIGDASRPILFVDVSDPSCPYCHIAAGKNPNLNKQAGPQFVLASDGGTYVPPVVEMRKLVDQGKASFVTIYSIGHGNGEMAQKSLYCAHEQGKFWQVHDLLYTEEGYSLINDIVKNDKAKSGELAQFLKSAIDPTFIKSCLDSGKYDQRIQSDLALATSLGVAGTPAFFVNDTRFPGAVSFTEMKSAVESAQ